LKTLIFTISLFFTTNVYGSDVIKEIRKIYYGNNEFIQKHSIQPICYLILHQGESAEPKSCSKLSKNYSGLVLEFRAYIYQKRILKIVEITYYSAGDQENTLEYYFYPSLNTAFVFEQHLTFNGIHEENGKDVSGLYNIERRFYFDKNGEKIRDIKKIFLLKSNEAIEIKPKSIQYWDPQIAPNAREITIYDFLIKNSFVK